MRKRDCTGARRGVLFYSDGLIEAHNPAREMFSFGRLQRLLGAGSGQGWLGTGERLVRRTGALHRAGLGAGR